jgi:hypothetical protein
LREDRFSAEQRRENAPQDETITVPSATRNFYHRTIYLGKEGGAMRKARMMVFAASAVLLAACQTDTASGGATPVTSVPTPAAMQFRPLAGAHEFRCPPAGTRVAYDSGVTIAHGGALPTDALVCRETRSSGEFTMFMASYSLPAADERSIRTGMAGLWPLADGKQRRLFSLVPPPPLERSSIKRHGGSLASIRFG